MPKCGFNFIEITLRDGSHPVIFSEHLFTRTHMEGCFWLKMFLLLQIVPIIYILSTTSKKLVALRESCAKAVAVWLNSSNVIKKRLRNSYSWVNFAKCFVSIDFNSSKKHLVPKPPINSQKSSYLMSVPSSNTSLSST